MKADTREFLLVEYAHLRNEILDALKEVPANEKWAVLTSGAFWTWIASFQKDSEYLPVIVWIPAVLTLVLFLRWRAIEAKFATFASYLFEVEEKLDLEGLGWEHYIRGIVRHWFRPYGWLLWIVLFVGNSALAVFVTIILAGSLQR